MSWKSVRNLSKTKDLQFARFTYATTIQGPVEEPEKAAAMLLEEQQQLVQLERALLILEGSSVIDRVTTLEGRIAALRTRVDQEIAKLTEAKKVFEAARQIDTSAKTVANEISTEQFDTVMPLLKELYRRLRPHSEWRERLKLNLETA